MIMMSILHLLWIVPLASCVGYITAAVLIIGKAGDSRE